MKFFRFILKTVCVLLAVALTLTAVFFRNNGVNIVSLDSKNGVRAESISVSDISEKNYKKIAESGYLELYFDEKTTGIMIKDAAGGKKWYAMPDGSESAMVSMTVFDKNGEHQLNSTTNSVAFSSFMSKITDSGVSVKYTMAQDKATAEKKRFSGDDIAFEVSADFTLKDGNFFVKAAYKNLSGNKNCAVADFSVLQYFGAFKDPKEDDFLLLPDGCGALACPYFESGENEYSCKVYGDDYALGNKKNNRALMGAFGMKRGESAYAVVIDSAEESAKIKAVSSKDGFSRIYADFSFDYMQKNEKNLYIYTNKSTSFSLCYKFLTKDNATYSDIASACREQFIRNGTLSAASIENADEVPMSLVLTGAYKEKVHSLKYDEYTTFSQAEDIIKRVKAKGVNNLSVRYTGVFENDSDRIIPTLGGKSGLKSLADYAKAQNVKLFLDLNVMTYESTFGRLDFSAARTMNKYTFNTNILNSLNQKKSVKFRTLKKSNDYIDSIIGKAAELGVTGFCVNDAGGILTSDFSASGAKRVDYKSGIMSQLSALSGVGDVMTDTGSIYTVKGSSSICSVPAGVSYEESKKYVKIPFVQSVLHGMTVLSSTPVNTASDSTEAMLRCIEYGLCPSFSVVYKKPEGSKMNVEFDSAASDIISAYTQVAEALDSLEGERITGHSNVKDGVFCTTYSDSTRIYVNYGDEAVTVSGVTVPEKGFVRIS